MNSERDRFLSRLAIVISVVLLSDGHHAVSQTLQPLYDGQGSKVDLQVSKDQTAIFGGYMFVADCDATLVFESGKYVRALPSGGKHVTVIQAYITQWKPMRSLPYWQHTYDSDGTRTSESLLVVPHNSGTLFGPCRDENGKIPDGLPIVGRKTESGAEFHAFDDSADETSDPVGPLLGTSYQFPPSPSDPARTDRVGYLILVVLVVLCAAFPFLWRLRKRGR